ncbi:hypothetical protein CLOSTMETH_01597, partial [[Clostridium] methylpentosum DSM 5476]
ELKPCKRKFTGLESFSNKRKRNRIALLYNFNTDFQRPNLNNWASFILRKYD